MLPGLIFRPTLRISPADSSYYWAVLERPTRHAQHRSGRRFILGVEPNKLFARKSSADSMHRFPSHYPLAPSDARSPTLCHSFDPRSDPNARWHFLSHLFPSFQSTLMFCLPWSNVLILVPISPISLAPHFALHAVSTRTPAMWTFSSRV